MDRSVLNEKLLVLKNRYVLTVPDRIADIASTLAGWANGGAKTTEQLAMQFHTLAGTAGTYKLMTVAATASEAEETCLEVDHSPLDREDFIYLSFLVKRLQHALLVDLR
jgi:chemotaxis protein histidine kinase CheA